MKLDPGHTVLRVGAMYMYIHAMQLESRIQVFFNRSSCQDGRKQKFNIYIWNYTSLYCSAYFIASKSAHHDDCCCSLDSDFTQNPLRTEHAHWDMCMSHFSCLGRYILSYEVIVLTNSENAFFMCIFLIWICSFAFCTSSSVWKVLWEALELLG